jgi:hypothetical protein
MQLPSPICPPRAYKSTFLMTVAWNKLSLNPPGSLTLLTSSSLAIRQLLIYGRSFHVSQTMMSVDLVPHKNIQKLAWSPSTKMMTQAVFMKLWSKLYLILSTQSYHPGRSHCWIVKESFIPHQQAKKKDSLPWITLSIRSWWNYLFCKPMWIVTPPNINM